jgi:hypothetical protein
MPIGNKTCNGKTEAVSIAFLMRKVVIISGEIGNGTVFQLSGEYSGLRRSSQHLREIQAEIIVASW